MIGRNGERGSGISALAARHDDDDDIYGMPFFYIYVYHVCNIDECIHFYIYILN